MKHFLITNKEVFLISYLVDAENIDEAFTKWENGLSEKVGERYQCDLSEYNKFSMPDVYEIGKDKDE